MQVVGWWCTYPSEIYIYIYVYIYIYELKSVGMIIPNIGKKMNMLQTTNHVISGIPSGNQTWLAGKADDSPLKRPFRANVPLLCWIPRG